jgi:hypothetical protein
MGSNTHIEERDLLKPSSFPERDFAVGAEAISFAVANHIHLREAVCRKRVLRNFYLPPGTNTAVVTNRDIVAGLKIQEVLLPYRKFVGFDKCEDSYATRRAEKSAFQIRSS